MIGPNREDDGRKNDRRKEREQGPVHETSICCPRTHHAGFRHRCDRYREGRSELLEFEPVVVESESITISDTRLGSGSGPPFGSCCAVIESGTLSPTCGCAAGAG